MNVEIKGAFPLVEIPVTEPRLSDPHLEHSYIRLLLTQNWLPVGHPPALRGFPLVPDTSVIQPISEAASILKWS